MNRNKIITIFIFFLFTSLIFSTVTSMQSKENAETMLLIRVDYTSENLEYIKQQHLDILGMKPNEWIDILIVEGEQAELDANSINYTITIDDVDEHCNSVRGTYHSFPEIETILQDIANNYPSITSLYSIGQSDAGREIWCLEITDNPGVDEDEPGVFYMGLHHAREWPTVEICLHIADELTSNYGSDPDITDVINNRRLWLVTCENPDGYVYSHDQGHNMWRKNRRYVPEHGTYGIDPNRNYPGSADGDIDGSWGSIGIASVTHDPSDDLFCGTWAGSEQCTQTIMNHFMQEDIHALCTWHTYSELVLWPYAYAYSAYTPDDNYLDQVGTQMASLITQQDGTGTYTPQKASSLYPTTGDTTDWVYGYSHYVKGIPCFPYTIEACTSFQPSTSYLDQICEENFDAALYLLEEAENIKNVVPRVIPPIITDMDTDSDGDFTVSWAEKNPDASPDYFQLDEMSDLSLVIDDAESGTDLWNLEGFSTTTARSHSATQSFEADNSDDQTSAMTSVHPLHVTLDTSFGFWTWYDIEDNYDMGFVEVSTDGRYYELLDIFNGNSNGWIYQEYSLNDYVDESIYIRFRYTTDGNTLGNGFFIDDITPVSDFSTITTLSDTITSTSYSVTGKSPGIYYYRVKGHNTEHDWGDFSTLKPMNVTSGGPSITIENILSNPIVQDIPGWVNSSCRVNSQDAVTSVMLNITFPDQSISYQTMDQFGTSNMYYLNQSYSQLGTYDYHIWARTTSNQKESYQHHFYIGPDFKFVDIDAGWNLITVPVEMGWSASDLADNISGCLSVSCWDSVNQTYDTYLPGWPDFDFPLVDGCGYFVDTDASGVLVCTGQLIGSVSVPLDVGWNLIGWYHDYDTLASSIADNISGCLSVNMWDSVNQTYDTYLPGWPDFDFIVEQGMGLFVDVDQQSMWHGEG